MSDTSLYLQLLLLTAILSVVTLVDVKTKTIPDLATIALAICGVAAQWLASSAAWALATGLLYFATFWLIREGHRRATGRIGLGLGDVKLAGAAGIWLTPAAVPIFMGTAAFAALTFVAAASIARGTAILKQRIPFGPFLALSLLVCWILRVSDIEVDAFYGS